MGFAAKPGSNRWRRSSRKRTPSVESGLSFPSFKPGECFAVESYHGIVQFLSHRNAGDTKEPVNSNQPPTGIGSIERRDLNPPISLSSVRTTVITTSASWIIDLRTIIVVAMVSLSPLDPQFFQVLHHGFHHLPLFLQTTLNALNTFVHGNSGASADQTTRKRSPRSEADTKCACRIVECGDSDIGKLVIQVAKEWKYKTISIIDDKPGTPDIIEELKALGGDIVIPESKHKNLSCFSEFHKGNCRN